jgi:hypothetical protein
MYLCVSVRMNINVREKSKVALGTKLSRRGQQNPAQNSASVNVRGMRWHTTSSFSNNQSIHNCDVAIDRARADLACMHAGA